MTQKNEIEIDKVNDRLDQFLNENKNPLFESLYGVDEDGNRHDISDTITDTFNPIKGFILLPRHPIYADMEFLRRFSRNLCDLVLIPHNTVVSRDHILYWNWTRNFSLRCKRQMEDFNIFTKSRSNLLSDFNTLVEIASLPWRFDVIDEESKEILNQGDLFQYEIGEINVLSQLGPSSLSLLDGFVTDPSIFDIDGQPKDKSIERPWRPESKSDGNWVYHDRILHWMEEESNETTSDSLEKINDLTRYEADWLENKAGVGEVDSKLDTEKGSTENYIHVLTGQRNYTIHGHGSGFSISPVAITLCCLYIWDNIKPSTYDNIRKNIKKEVDNPYPDWTDKMR
jgi:hypothetical protein